MGKNGAKMHTAAPPHQTMTVFDWMDRRGVAEKAAVGGASAAAYAERPFFLPTFDSKTPIAEGPPPLDWEGYHAGKHGVYERFANMKGEMVNMGDLFFKEKFRWVRPEYRSDANTLKYIKEAEAQQALDLAYKFDPTIKPAQRPSLSGIFDSDLFTQDLGNIYSKYASSTKSTIWQGRYVYPDGSLGDLQTNVDFEAFGHNWRAALDAKTGRMLNFFKVEVVAGRKPMQFSEIVIKWKGKITDVVVHKHPSSSFTVEVSATWQGLFKQGMKGGALTGGIVGAFLGCISGFRKGGIPGALEGLAIGGLVGAGSGALMGGILALVTRVAPWVARAVKIGGGVLTVAAILLDSSETSLDPQEFGPNKKDDDGNTWCFRNIHNTGGTLFPKYEPRGIKTVTTDNVTMEWGEESPTESSYSSRRTPILVWAGGKQKFKKVRWHMMRTPEGSSTWWWMDMDGEEEFMVSYRDDAAMSYALDVGRVDAELPSRFKRTQN